jgi:hypothetical protein
VFAKPLTRELFTCWLQNPGRFGTVESIVEWWLLEQQIRETTVEVRALLEHLVATGLVETWVEADGRTYYRMNRDKENEVRAWVKSKSI